MIPEISNDIKRSLFAGVIITIIVSCCYLFGKYVVSMDSFDPVNNIVENYSLSDLYINWHKRTDAISPYIIVDISDIKERSEIAGLLAKIDSVHPKVIGLDVFFSPAVKMPKDESDSLLHVIRRMQSPLVVASILTPIDDKRNMHESSFFMSEIDNNSNIYEGIIDFPRDSKTVRAYQSIWKEGDAVYVSFTKRIADLAEIPMPADEDMHLIDFSSQDTTIFLSKELINPDILTNRVVLIGDTKDKQDMYPVPVSLNSSRYCSGVEIHKQVLATAASGWKPRKTAEWFEILISILVIYIFCTMAYYIGAIRDGQLKILVILMSALCIIIAVWIGDCLFWNGTYFSMKYILIGIALSSTAIDLYASVEVTLKNKNLCSKKA